MKSLFLILLFTSTICDADEVSETFWSYACEMYIYVFDTNNSTYRIYSRINAEGSASGKYTSYLLTEDQLNQIGASLYSLTSKEVSDAAEADFSEPRLITMQSPKHGYVALYPCDHDEVIKLITDAEQYFEQCPKDVITKCP